MTYEKNLEEKIERLEKTLDDTQEVSDSLAETLKEIKRDCKHIQGSLETCIDVMGEVISNDNANKEVCDTHNKSYWDLQSTASTIHHIIEEIENKLDDYGL